MNQRAGIWWKAMVVFRVIQVVDLGIKEHCRFRKVKFVFVFWTEEVAAICHAVVVQLAGRPSLGNDLKMIAIRNEFRASEESRYYYSFVAIGRLSTSPRPR